MAKLLTLHTPQWWWRSFAAGVAFIALFRRAFPELIPWPEAIPEGARAPILLCAGILIGTALQAAWWILTSRQRGLSKA
jgi:hypothetical protein